MEDSKDVQVSFVDKCKKFVNEISRDYPVSFGYLFGSRAKGNNNAMSDIDIALMFEKNYEDEEDVFIRGDIIETGKKVFQRICRCG